MIRPRFVFTGAIAALLFVAHPARADSLADAGGQASEQRLRTGRTLFERETFGGNGRTCATCHPNATGTVSPVDAQARFAKDPHDPLFLADGSDDGRGNGVTRMLADATVLVTVPLAARR